MFIGSDRRGGMLVRAFVAVTTQLYWVSGLISAEVGWNTRPPSGASISSVVEVADHEYV